MDQKHSKIPKKDRDLYWVGDMDFDEKTTDFLMKYTISEEGTKLDTVESWLVRSKIIFQGLDPYKFQSLNHKMLTEICLPKTVEKVVETYNHTFAADVLFTGCKLLEIWPYGHRSNQRKIQDYILHLQNWIRGKNLEQLEETYAGIKAIAEKLDAGYD